jgi:hypothetical protein
MVFAAVSANVTPAADEASQFRRVLIIVLVEDLIELRVSELLANSVRDKRLHRSILLSQTRSPYCNSPQHHLCLDNLPSGFSPWLLGKFRAHYPTKPGPSQF